MNNNKEQKQLMINIALEEYLNTPEEYRRLYENATIYLERKYNKYLEFCRLEEESSLRKSSKIGEGCDANPEVTLT